MTTTVCFQGPESCQCPVLSSMKGKHSSDLWQSLRTPAWTSSSDSDSMAGGEMVNVSKATRTGDSPVPRDRARGRRDHRWPCESDVVQAVPWQAAFDGSVSI